MRRLVPLLGLLAATVACLPVSGAVAASFAVTTTADSGPGSLRTAITSSNNPDVRDTITITATGTIQLQTALPIVIDDVTIAGPGAGSLVVRRAVSDPFRIFQFGSVNATVRDLTISNGLETGAGGILSSGGSLTLTRVVVSGNEAVAEGSSFALATGGGIYSSGSLTLRESVVHGNSAIATEGSTETIAGGGGIEATGPVTVERSTISDNTAKAFGGSGAETNAAGGGLLLMGGLATIVQSTISGNSVLASGGTGSNVAQGGGLYGGGVTLTGSTVTRNAADTAGSATIELARGSNLQHPGSSILRNTIVAEPLGEADSCGISPSSGGFNLDEDGSCKLEQGTDLTGVVADLEPLAANGGFAPTHALTTDSAAVDRGDSFGYAADQRGLPRPNDFTSISNSEGGDGSDIGAFELQPPPAPAVPAPVKVTEVAADRQPPNTRIVIGPPRVTYKRLAKFRFASTEPQSSFQCKVDKGRWRRCANPFKRKVKAGAKHLFKVRAIDRFGNVDPTPARFGWRVKSLGG